MVDDESKPERRPSKHMRTPEEWDVTHNPAFSYYSYYIYANLYTLNKLRESKGLNTISFEAGTRARRATSTISRRRFCSPGTSRTGSTCASRPCCSTSFTSTQIGLNMSPTVQQLAVPGLPRNPFPMYFARGLVVTLSTDDPLQIHMTKEPLVEEYSVAAQVWKLSAADLCEIARNSVLNSDFPHVDKQHWVSERRPAPAVPRGTTSSAPTSRTFARPARRARGGEKTHSTGRRASHGQGTRPARLVRRKGSEVAARRRRSPDAVFDREEGRD